MRYEEFRAAWHEALRASGLRHHGPGRETLDPSTLERKCEVFVEPVGGQHVEPFHVSAGLSFAWTSVHTARSRSTEEDLVNELLGRGLEKIDTDRPSLRVDITLRAAAPYGKPLPMPSKAAWAKWAREALARMERIEPVIPEEHVREADDGMLEILGWRSEPEVRAVCTPGGELNLEGVELSAWQAIELPRQWDDPDREADEPPHRQLREMMERVRAALHAWMEVMDHLL